MCPWASGGVDANDWIINWSVVEQTIFVYFDSKRTPIWHLILMALFGVGRIFWRVLGFRDHHNLKEKETFLHKDHSSQRHKLGSRRHINSQQRYKATTENEETKETHPPNIATTEEEKYDPTSSEQS